MMKANKKNIFWYEPSVTLNDRCERNGYRSCLLWFTGLSASGKSTIAHTLDRRLHQHGIHSYVLDGDNIRHGLNKDLGLNPEDRKENIRRVGEVSKLFLDAGLIMLAAFIAPYREDRRQVKRLLEKGQFIEVFVHCPIEECEKRDPKGVYRKARKGEIRNLTGLSAPYEEPENPQITLETDKKNIEECVNILLSYLIKNGYITEKLLDKDCETDSSG
jgi:adenylylsulfate kinase